MISSVSVGGGSVYFGAHPVTGAGLGLATAFTPAVIAKLYLSPIGRKYLTLGYLIPAETKQAVEFLVKLAEVAGVKIPPNIGKLGSSESSQNVAANTTTPPVDDNDDNMDNMPSESPEADPNVQYGDSNWKEIGEE